MTENKGTARPRGTDSAKVIQVIVTESLAGNGTQEDPCWIKVQYWSLDGQLPAVGPITKTGKEQTHEQPANFQQPRVRGNRTIQKDGEPWFVLKDVARVLDSVYTR